MVTLNDIQFIFNRAFEHSFSWKKLALITVTLLLCGIVVLFFRGLSIQAGPWIGMSLAFFPFFLSMAGLLAAEIFIIRVYHDEVKHREFTYAQILQKSWTAILGSSYFSIPVILGYLLLWMLLGIFFLLQEIPGVGPFVAIVLSFAPFILNAISLGLCLVSIGLLYLVAPIVALKGPEGLRVAQTINTRLKHSIFANLLLVSIGFAPIVVVFLILTFATWLTSVLCYTCNTPIYVILQWFFLLTPFSFLLAPAVVFFFNFSAEAHVYLLKQETRTEKT